MARRFPGLLLRLGLAVALLMAGLGHAAPSPRPGAHGAHGMQAVLVGEPCCPEMDAADCRDMHATHVCCLLPEAPPLPPSTERQGCWPSTARLEAMVVAPQPRPPDSSAA